MLMLGLNSNTDLCIYHPFLLGPIYRIRFNGNQTLFSDVNIVCLILSPGLLLQLYFCPCQLTLDTPGSNSHFVVRINPTHCSQLLLVFFRVGITSNEDSALLPRILQVFLMKIRNHRVQHTVVITPCLLAYNALRSNDLSSVRVYHSQGPKAVPLLPTTSGLRRL